MIAEPVIIFLVMANPGLFYLPGVVIPSSRPCSSWSIVRWSFTEVQEGLSVLQVGEDRFDAKLKFSPARVPPEMTSQICQWWRHRWRKFCLLGCLCANQSSWAAELKPLRWEFGFVWFVKKIISAVEAKWNWTKSFSVPAYSKKEKDDKDNKL